MRQQPALIVAQIRASTVTTMPTAQQNCSANDNTATCTAGASLEGHPVRFQIAAEQSCTSSSHISTTNPAASTTAITKRASPARLELRWLRSGFFGSYSYSVSVDKGSGEESRSMSSSTENEGVTDLGKHTSHGCSFRFGCHSPHGTFTPGEPVMAGVILCSLGQ